MDNLVARARAPRVTPRLRAPGGPYGDLGRGYAPPEDAKGAGLLTGPAGSVASRTLRLPGGPAPVYVIERGFAGRLGLSEPDAERLKLIDDDEGVRWLLSFLDASSKKSYCVFEAPDADATTEPTTQGAAG